MNKIRNKNHMVLKKRTKAYLRRRHNLYNRRWVQSHKHHARYLDYRCMTRSFLRRYATSEDLKKIAHYCKIRMRTEVKPHE